MRDRPRAQSLASSRWPQQGMNGKEADLVCHGEPLEGFRQRWNRLMCSFPSFRLQHGEDESRQQRKQGSHWEARAVVRERWAVGRTCIRRSSGAAESKWFNNVSWRKSTGTC